MNPILRKVFLERNFFSPLFGGFPLVHVFFGGGSAPAQPTTTTVNQNKLPDYAQPYYNALMGASTNQIFNTDTSGNITGTKPYVPYSSNPSDYVAPFSPLQQQAFQGYSNLNLPNQFNPATQLAATSGVGQLNTANQAAGYGAQGSQSGQLGQNIGVSGGMGTAQQALNYGGQGSALGNLSALQSANQAGQQQAQAGAYGGMGAQAGQNAQNIGYAGGMGTAAQALGYGAQGAGYGAGSVQAGQGLQNTLTNANAMSQYMNPYIQNALTPALQLQNQSYGMKGAQEQGQATQSGAFGGSREALMNSLNAQGNALANQQMIGSAYNTAYTNAQQAANQATQAQLQGLQQGISGAGMGLQGVQGAQAGVGQALQGQQLGISGAQAGLSGVGAQTNASQMQQAGMGQALQGVGYGLQGVQGAQAGVNQALAGTAQGISGANMGLQGVSGQQAGYAGANQAAGTLGTLGSQQLAAQQGILSAQGAAGAQQQAQQQNIINQAVQNYGTAQQYPYQLLNQYNALLQGYSAPTASSTTYQAAPSALSQIGGLGATALGLAGSAGAFKKKGGVIKEKKYAGGGLVELAISKAMRA